MCLHVYVCQRRERQNILNRISMFRYTGGIYVALVIFKIGISLRVHGVKQKHKGNFLTLT